MFLTTVNGVYTFQREYWIIHIYIKVQKKKQNMEIFTPFEDIQILKEWTEIKNWVN